MFKWIPLTLNSNQKVLFSRFQGCLHVLRTNFIIHLCRRIKKKKCTRWRRRKSIKKFSLLGSVYNLEMNSDSQNSRKLVKVSRQLKKEIDFPNNCILNFFIKLEVLHTWLYIAWAHLQREFLCCCFIFLFSLFLFKSSRCGGVYILCTTSAICKDFFCKLFSFVCFSLRFMFLFSLFIYLIIWINGSRLSHNVATI